jgi:GT2 family glycosyltransferase
LTISCLKKIIEYNESVTVIVVDNFSENQSLENIRDAFLTTSSVLISEDDMSINTISRLILIQTKSNYGYAKGNNIGIKFALKGNFEYIVILNNDIIVKDDIFTNISNYINNVSSDYVLFGPLLYNCDGSIFDYSKKKLAFIDLLLFSPLSRKLKNMFWKQHQKKYTYDDNFPQDVDFIAGCFMFFRKELFDKIDGFDPNTFLYFEEVILCNKIQNCGCKIMFLPMFNVIHLHGATTSTLPDSNIFKANETYKSMIYYLKNYSNFNMLEKIVISLFHKISILLLTLIIKFNLTHKK